MDKYGAVTVKLSLNHCAIFNIIAIRFRARLNVPQIYTILKIQSVIFEMKIKHVFLVQKPYYTIRKYKLKTMWLFQRLID